MQLSLSPEMEEFVNRKIASGHYGSADEVIQDALRLMEENDRLRETRFEQLHKEIALGMEQLDRGEKIPAETVFAELRAKGKALDRDRS